LISTSNSPASFPNWNRMPRVAMNFIGAHSQWYCTPHSSPVSVSTSTTPVRVCGG
jgi:hypothetical protein